MGTQRKKTGLANPGKLPPFDGEDNAIVNVIVETPMGSRNKFKYDETTGIYTLSTVLPHGMTFPAAFGFVPSTRAEDGDPEDILVLTDEPVFTGCLVPSRIIGIMEAEQTEDGETTRNDRLIAVAAGSRDHSDIKSVSDLNDNTVHEIEQFFVAYNRERRKEFKVLGCKGPKRALKLLQKSIGRDKRAV